MTFPLIIDLSILLIIYVTLIYITEKNKVLRKETREILEENSDNLTIDSLNDRIDRARALTKQFKKYLTIVKIQSTVLAIVCGHIIYQIIIKFIDFNKK